MQQGAERLQSATDKVQLVDEYLQGVTDKVQLVDEQLQGATDKVQLIAQPHRASLASGTVRMRDSMPAHTSGDTRTAPSLQRIISSQA